MFDVKKALEEAKKEISEEKFKKAKERYKTKLRELEQAKTIVANLNRELEDLEMELSNEV